MQDPQGPKLRPVAASSAMLGSAHPHLRFADTQHMQHPTVPGVPPAPQPAAAWKALCVTSTSQYWLKPCRLCILNGQQQCHEARELRHQQESSQGSWLALSCMRYATKKALRGFCTRIGYQVCLSKRGLQII